MLFAIIRWIAFLPLSGLAYAAMKVLFLVPTMWVLPDDTIREIVYSNGLGGHYLRGPLIIAAWEAAATVAGIGAGLYCAPAFRMQVAWLLSALWLAVVMAGLFFLGAQFEVQFNDGEWWARTISEIVGGGIVVGCVLVNSRDFNGQAIN